MGVGLLTAASPHPCSAANQNRDTLFIAPIRYRIAT